MEEVLGYLWTRGHVKRVSATCGLETRRRVLRYLWIRVQVEKVLCQVLGSGEVCGIYVRVGRSNLAVVPATYVVNLYCMYCTNIADHESRENCNFKFGCHMLVFPKQNCLLQYCRFELLTFHG